MHNRCVVVWDLVSCSQSWTVEHVRKGQNGISGVHILYAAVVVLVLL